MKSMKRSSLYSDSDKTRKIRKLLNEEVKLGIHPSSDSETEEVDLHKELHPLSHYMNNKEEMIEQMFSIIKGDKLMKMLPPILKDIPLDELKADCLIHLLGMSKKRIMAILEGKEINSSSDSETHSDNSSPRRKRKPIVKPVVIKQEGCSDISDNSEEVILIDPDRELFESLTNTKSMKNSMKGSGKSRKEMSHSKNARSKNKMPEKRITTRERNKEADNQESESEDLHESSPDNTNSNEGAPKEGKTLLEILELEMRARAIRALLHKSESTEGNEDVTVPEKISPSRNISDESERKKITPKKKFRKKKRKNDDVIVITPKVVTIDLTDENDVSSAKKKQTPKNKKSENVMHPSKDDAAKELQKTIIEGVSDKNVQIDIIEIRTDCTLIDDKEEESKSTEPNISSELSAQNIEQSNKQKTEEQKSNWAQRWLESKEVKKVVSTSKICGNIRKRIKNAKLAKQNQKQNQESEPQQVESQEICGSVNEYQLLSKSSRVSDPNASLLEIGNSKNNLVSNEGECEKQTVTETNSTISTVEQVQDVTSTKSEVPSDSQFLDENTVDDASQGNITVESKIDNFKQDTTHVTSESCDVGRLYLEQNSPASEEGKITKENNLSSDMIENPDLNNPVFHCVGDTSEKNKPFLDRTIEFEDGQPNLYNTKCAEKTEYLVLPTINDADSSHSSDEIQVANTESESIYVNKEIKCSEQNIITTNQSCNERPCESNSGNVTNAEAVKSCELNSLNNKINKNQISEPETLEINITDEDMNIDGIVDEQSEIDSTNTATSTTKVSEID